MQFDPCSYVVSDSGIGAVVPVSDGATFSPLPRSSNRFTIVITYSLLKPKSPVGRLKHVSAKEWSASAGGSIYDLVKTDQ